MTEERPAAIHAKHLARRAIVYVRQSSEGQVVKNQGSLDAQRSQAELAIAWGWSQEQIDVIDDDLGLSGAATEHRQGYKKMVEAIRKGQVGIVFLTDYSRAGRRAVEWLLFLEDCDRYDVLLAIDGRVYDPKDLSARFMSQLQALVGEHDNLLRRGHLERGRLAKIKAGKTVTQPPVGYVRLPDGAWIRDPDVTIQDGVRAVFRVFLEGRSLSAAVRILTLRSQRVPQRRTGHPASWVEPTVSAIQRIITNPSYTGDYVWGRRRSDARFGRDRHGHARARRVPLEQAVIVANHHEPYVTRQEWATIQMILAENRWNGPRPGGLGRGAALLQGLIRCRRHRGRRMAPCYKNRRKDGTKSHAYHCIGEYHEGGEQCGHRPGKPIDDAVVQVVLSSLAPPAIELVRALWRQALADARSEQRRQGDELRQAEREVEDLWERFMSVDATCRLVRADLERRLEKAKARVAALRDGTPVPSAIELFDEAAFTDLLRLATDLQGIWCAIPTTDADRKEILRAVIDAVYVEAYDRETIALTIRWSDGRPDTSVRVTLPPHAHRLIRQWASQGLDHGEIAQRLNEGNIPTKYLTRWTSAAVHRALARMRKKGADA